MKTYLILLILLIPNLVLAQVDIQIGQHTADNAGRWDTAKIRYYMTESAYLHAAKERAEVLIGNFGEGFDYDLTGIGVGTKQKLTDNISVYGDLTYYSIKNKCNCAGTNEALYYFFNSNWNDIHDGNFVWSHYQISNSDTVGGEVGIELKQKMGLVDVSMGIGYRVLKINQNYAAYLADFDGVFFEIGGTADYSGPLAHLTFMMRW